MTTSAVLSADTPFVPGSVVVTDMTLKLGAGVMHVTACMAAAEFWFCLLIACFVPGRRRRRWVHGARCPAASLQKKTLHTEGFLCHNPGSTWDSDENRYAAGRLPGIFESWNQTNAEIPCDPQRWLK